MIVLAEVLTNCEDDIYKRVKVKSPHVWEESDLIPSLNGIYLEKGDQVIVDISAGVDNAYIKGKLYNKNQNDKSVKGEGVILYEARNGEDWTAAWVTKDKFYWKNSKGVSVSIQGDKIEISQKTKFEKADEYNIEASKLYIKAESAVIEASNAEVKSDSIKLDGKVEFTHGSGAPDGKGPLLCIPNCLFSGAVISGSKTE